mmetsp:Transcript_24737/g.33928  ORF Transcript_24737/g.33928 Transcript_24737/m.33928 type:complete len:322 (+) Transcript_24737:926-1891(+)
MLFLFFPHVLAFHDRLQVLRHSHESQVRVVVLHVLHLGLHVFVLPLDVVDRLPEVFDFVERLHLIVRQALDLLVQRLGPLGGYQNPLVRLAQLLHLVLPLEQQHEHLSIACREAHPLLLRLNLLLDSTNRRYQRQPQFLQVVVLPLGLVPRASHSLDLFLFHQFQLPMLHHLFPHIDIFQVVGRVPLEGVHLELWSFRCGQGSSSVERVQLPRALLRGLLDGLAHRLGHGSGTACGAAPSHFRGYARSPLGEGPSFVHERSPGLPPPRTARALARSITSSFLLVTALPPRPRRVGGVHKWSRGVDRATHVRVPHVPRGSEV